MKDKILIGIIAFLAGAVLTTGAFCAFTLVNNNCHKDKGQMQMNGGTPPTMSNSQSGSNSQSNQPPEMPSGQSNSGNNNQPPEQPSNDNNNSQNNNS